MTTTVQKWGNSLGVRIPKDIAKKMRFVVGSRITVTPEKGRVVIKAAAQPSAEENVPSLEELLRRVTPRNRHPETYWGPPRGREVW